VVSWRRSQSQTALHFNDRKQLPPRTKERKNTQDGREGELIVDDRSANNRRSNVEKLIRRHTSCPFENVLDENSGRNIDMGAIYNDLRSPSSFGIVTNFKRHSGHSESAVKTFLAEQYTLHQPKRIRCPRHKTYSKGYSR